MVTFFCVACGEYLKKKQGETHGYCSLNLVCSLCKTEVNGYSEIRGHISCPKAKNKKIIKRRKSSFNNILDFSNYKWNGFKNTLRKIVRETKNQKIEKNLLKRSFENLFKKYGNQTLNYKFVFDKKLGKTKNLKLEGNYIAYKVKE